MSAKSVARGLVVAERRLAASASHAEMVAFYREKLANMRSPLDDVSPEQRALAREEFRLLPEIAGRPLPVRKPPGERTS